LDEPFIKIRMLAIWVAQEAIVTGVAERDYPSGFLG
jgi:hypothetical protein